MPSPCSASFIKIILQLILLEEHGVRQAGQNTHIPRAFWEKEVWMSVLCPCGTRGLGCMVGITGWWHSVMGELNSLNPLHIPTWGGEPEMLTHRTKTCSLFHHCLTIPCPVLWFNPKSPVSRAVSVDHHAWIIYIEKPSCSPHIPEYSNLSQMPTW